MTSKVIKSILRKKFNDFAESIKDESVRKMVEKNSIITGGAIVSLLMNEKPKDYDVYFTDKATAKAVAQYYVKLFNDKHGAITNRIGFQTKAFVLDGAEREQNLKDNEGWDWGSHMLKISEDRIKIIVRSDGVAAEDDKILDEPFEDVYDAIDPESAVERGDDLPGEELDKEEGEKYRPIFLSSNAITLSGNIQIVIRFYGDAKEIHSNYDFVHCTNYWLSDNGELVLNPAALESILAKQLVYQGSKYPLASVIRTRKFIKRGWNINAGQYLKMFFQIADLNLKDIAVLEDQLVGVDSAYFMALIGAIENKIKSDSSFQITNEYVCSIIDRIFG